MTERFLIQPSEKPDHWVCTDTELGIVCIFENEKFNETQKFTMLNNGHPDVGNIARSMREMGDWLRENHYEKIFP